MRSLLVVPALLFPLLLGGCGYKGPLYLPEDKPEAAKPRAVTPPSPPAAPASSEPVLVPQ